MAEERPPRYCSVCHHELKPDDLSCPECGTPLILEEAHVPTPEADRAVPVPPQPDAGAPGAPAQEQAAQEQLVQEQPEQRGWWRRHPILSGGVGIIVVLLVFISVVGSLGGGGGGEENKKSTSGGTASIDRLIVFRRYLDLELTRSAIFTMYPDGTHVRQITHPPEGFRDGSPAWSPDGTKVAFHREAIDESTSRILVLNTKTGDSRQVEGAEGFDPAFSPDGKRLAFKGIDGIWIIGLDGSDPHQVSNIQKRGALEYEDFGPAFSPEGKRLVFERSRLADDHTAVFVQSLASHGSPEDARQITPWEMNCHHQPEFSPDGDWVLFSCSRQGGISNLYWVNPDGTGFKQLTHQVYADKTYVGSSFSAEFKGWGDIVASRHPADGYEGNSDVFRMHIDIAHGDVAPSERVSLTKSETLDDAPDWGTH